MASLRRFGRSNTGAAAVEFAIIAMVLIVVCVSVFEFGRGLHVRNELSSAGDRAARKILTDPTVSDQDLIDEVRSAFTGPQPELLEVTFADETADGVAFRTMLIQYPISLLIPGLGDTINLTLSRRVPTG